MKETVFNALLRRNKQEKINEDAIFLEYEFNDIWLSVFAAKDDDFIISELYHSEEIRLTNNQKEILQKLVNSKIVKMRGPIDEYFENGVKPENFY